MYLIMYIVYIHTIQTCYFQLAILTDYITFAKLLQIRSTVLGNEVIK